MSRLLKTAAPGAANACGIGLAVLLLVLTPPTIAAANLVHDIEIALYETIVNHGLADDPRILVIAAETTGDPAAIAEHDEAARAIVADLGAPPEALDGWIRMNATTAIIDRPLRLSVTYQLLDQDARRKLFAAAAPQIAWSQFFARYEGAPGLLRLSRAGFDDTREHALVYVEHQCGVECGAGRLIHLQRGVDDSWQVKGAALVWMVE
jgi:hypothetical protein